MISGLESKSLRNKLVFTSMWVTGLAVIIGMVISIVEDVRFTRQTTQEQLQVLTNVVAASSASALIFNDTDAAHQTLALLKANDAIINAVLVNKEKKVFAVYEREGQEQFASNFKVMIHSPVILGSQEIGYLDVTGSMVGMLHNLLTQWLLKLSILMVIFFLSYLVLRDTSNDVLNPVQRLVKAIRAIIDSGDYSLRVEKTGADELAELTEEFNLMLSQIEDRDDRLQQSNEALAQVQEPIMLRDAELRCQYINPAFTALFGYTLEELKNNTFSLRPSNEVGPEVSQHNIYDIAKTDGVYRGETYRETKDGVVIPVQRHISPVKDKSGEVKGYVTVLTDISEKKHAEQIIWRQANYDALTGLPNRFMFMQRLKRALSDMHHHQQPLALLFLDLDLFKEINDTLGHDMGDALLKETANRIVGCLRGRETDEHIENVARLGGDEFTVILTSLEDSNDVEIVAKRILDRLSKPFRLGSEVVHISASIGIVETYPNESLDSETLIKYADIAMYDAKQQGRNRYSRFSQTMLFEAQKRRRLINDIHKALANNEFQLVYQPIVDIQTNEVRKAEALIRWHHPTEGLVKPNDFVAAAEDSGLIVEIGDWVFKKAAQQVAIWRETIHKDFQISINKSPVQLNAANEVHMEWFDYLSERGLPGESVIVEITEGVFLNKNELVTEKLLAFRDAGMQVSLDDFGTGYSSLSYLLKFDIDYIKIDQSFVQNLSINSEDMVLCEAMIVMAQKLGMKVVAEGIETQQQLDILMAAGCDYGQGYLLSKPLSSKAFERLYQVQNVTTNNEALLIA